MKFFFEHNKKKIHNFLLTFTFQKKYENCENCENKLKNTKYWKNKSKWKCQNSNFEINFIFLSRDLDDFDVSICI